MANKRITVVLSQGQSKNPVHRRLEEDIAAALLVEPELDVSIVPHLYDLPPDHTGMLFLRSIPGDLVVLAWLYPRAVRWVLDRAGVKGQPGRSLLDRPADGDDDDVGDDEGDDANRRTNGHAGPTETKVTLGSFRPPSRRIYCLDLRDHGDAKTYVDEVKRIASESAVQTIDLRDWIQGQPKAEQLARYLDPLGQRTGESNGTAAPPKRRWYPVIDYDRCTNCMECIDFCLFGVYGIDEQERIFVELQDNCKKGCPACSRVCPENAILFPEYKAPAIAGAPVAANGTFKIDLSKLFGGDDKSALELAVAERDRELLADGREAVGMSQGIPKRQQHRAEKPRDELDDLFDDLDNLAI